MFCSKCGKQLEDGVSFCSACGNPVGQPAQPKVEPQPVIQPVYIQAVKQKIPGRGLGISGMILGIIGLVYGFILLIESFIYIGSGMGDFFDMEEGIAGVILFYSILSVLAVSLAAAGRVKGYKNGVSMSGVVMGVIGLFMFIIAALVILSA